MLLDTMEEYRALSPAELLLRSFVKDQLSMQHKALDLYWKQRYRFKMCKLGDGNTNFLHASASARLQKNQIKVLHKNGVTIYSHGGKEKILFEFYNSLLGATVPTSWAFNLRDLYPLPLNLANMDTMLSEEEIKSALVNMRSSSSPGPDGFGPAFYKTFWDTTKQDVLQLCQSFCGGQVNLEGINQAHIVLIPKKDDVLTVDGFRPISLQNCPMKIISKGLTTRLQHRIIDLVSDYQTGFIKGHNITDSFMLAAELIQCCHKRKVPTIVLKLDFKKAFDSISWDALDTIMDTRGFSGTWRSWMRNILDTGRTAALLNGIPGLWINAEEGCAKATPYPHTSSS